MNKFYLCELGLAALFHDIGYCDLPPEIVDKPGELTAEEWQEMKKNPLYGVRKVMKLKGIDDLTARIITGMFEHHLRADFSGYPRLGYRKLGLLGRIIGIADSYDGLTSSRVSGRTAYPPHKALRVMLSQSRKSYDQAQWDNPLVWIISDEEGREVEGGEVVALGSPSSPRPLWRYWIPTSTTST